jgi:hypothetical protein
MPNKTKADLINDLQTMTKEKDILADKLDLAETTIRVIDEDNKNMETDILRLQKRDDTLEIIFDMIDNLHISQSRYAMGILTELETMEKITDQLLGMRELRHE